MAQLHEGLLEDHKWSGEFFEPNKYEDRFQGKLSFTVEDGVWLDYRFPVKQRSQIDRLWGILDNGKKCTLVGDFKPSLAGWDSHNGLNTTHGNQQFQYLLIGEHVSLTETFNNVCFELTHLHDFFSAKGFKDIQKFSNKPLHRSQVDFGSIEFGNSAKFIMLQDDLECHIHCEDGDAFNEFQAAFRIVREKYPQSHFLLKKDLGYVISIHHDSLVEPDTLLDKVYALVDVFSLLLYSPVLPDNVCLIKKEDGHRLSLEIYPTRLNAKDTLHLCREKRSYHDLPINAAHLNLEHVLTEWFKHRERYESIVASVQNMTGLTHRHETNNNIILFATQLENISQTQNHNKEKYSYPFQSYACDHLRERVEKIIKKVGYKDIGKAIGDLRGEIAHVGRPQKASSSFSFRDMIDISQCMQLTIIGYVLEQIGVPKESIERYQYKLIPYR